MIVDVPGFRVGHWTDARAATGCTVILPPPGTLGSVYVAGGSPATRETDALQPGTRVREVHAVLLTGGSAFGLAAADGVVRWLAEREIGWPTPAALVPIVPSAALYDLLVGDAGVRPGPAEGYAACDAASEDERAEGNVGAGMGATVGKQAGFDFMSKGGLGSASVRQGTLVVGALAVVNAVGDVVADDGSIIAGARAEPVHDPALLGLPPGPAPASATTLACVATNADLSKEEANRVARMAATGLARAIRPVHTMFDGDTVFVLATRSDPSPVELVGRLAADALAEAARRGVRAATDIPRAPALGRR